jgi:hypothetical protein
MLFDGPQQRERNGSRVKRWAWISGTTHDEWWVAGKRNAIAHAAKAPARFARTISIPTATRRDRVKRDGTNPAGCGSEPLSVIQRFNVLCDRSQIGI